MGAGPQERASDFGSAPSGSPIWPNPLSSARNTAQGTHPSVSRTLGVLHPDVSGVLRSQTALSGLTAVLVSHLEHEGQERTTSSAIQSHCNVRWIVPDAQMQIFSLEITSDDKLLKYFSISSEFNKQLQQRKWRKLAECKLSCLKRNNRTRPENFCSCVHSLK